MSIPHAGWPVAADDGEPTRPAGAGAASRGVKRTSSEPALRSPRPPGTGRQPARPAVSVLADRLAAALVHHEPGWRLPRHSALARRYNVSSAEIDAAVEDLVGRHLVRRLADGQLYRSSPAEYVIGLEGVRGLLSTVDTMGGEFSCRSRQVTWRMPPEDISWALQLTPDQQVCVLRYLWTADGEAAALCTSYVPGDVASQPDAGAPAALPAVLDLLQLSTATEGAGASRSPDGEQVAGSPTALHIELQAPPPSVARSLRLTAGQPAMMVTVRFCDVASGRPVALTITVLRPDMFRVVVQTPQPPLPDGYAGNLSGSWAHAVEDWEP